LKSRESFSFFFKGDDRPQNFAAQSIKSAFPFFFFFFFRLSLLSFFPRLLDDYYNSSSMNDSLTGV
jgi:hypothetical protein